MFDKLKHKNRHGEVDGISSDFSGVLRGSVEIFEFNYSCILN